MSNFPAHRASARGVVDVGRGRQLQRAMDDVAGRTDLAVTQVQAAAEEAAAVVQARNAVAAAAAQADAVLSGMLGALPIHDPMDADFRSQLKQATRSRVIAEIWQFDP